MHTTYIKHDLNLILANLDVVILGFESLIATVRFGRQMHATLPSLINIINITCNAWKPIPFFTDMRT